MNSEESQQLAERLKVQCAALQGDVTRRRRDAENNAGHRTEADIGGELTLILIERDTGLIREIEEALDRIVDGTYGVCEDCSRCIPGEWLRAVPHARRCVKCETLCNARTSSSRRVY